MKRTLLRSGACIASVAAFVCLSLAIWGSSYQVSFSWYMQGVLCAAVAAALALMASQ